MQRKTLTRSAMFISIYENSKLKLKSKSYCHPVVGQQRQSNKNVAGTKKMGPFLSCVPLSTPAPPPLTRTFTHTHAYHDKWPVTCLCEHGTKGSTPSPQGWQSGSLGQQRRRLRSASALPLELTAGKSFHLLGGGQREPTEETQQYQLGRVRCRVTAQQ